MSFNFMKNLGEKLIPLLKTGSCTPLISQLAKKIKEPSATIHYNIKKLEQDGSIISYKAVFNNKKINQGFGVYVLITLSPDEYGDPERIAHDLAKHPQIEAIDICTGDWEMVLKVQCKDQDEYYEFMKKVISRKGITKIKSLTSLKQVKTEYVNL